MYTESEVVSIKINTNEIDTTAVCTSNIFTKVIDMSTISDSTSVSIDVTELTYSSSQTYSISDVIQVTFSLSEDVIVTGTTRVELLPESKSTSNLYANFVSGSGSSTLIFEYTVNSGDGDNNGLDLSSLIDLAGSTLLDTAGNSLDLNLASTNFAAVLIDSQSPMITSFIEPANATYADGGGELLFQVNFSEIVNITGVPRVSLNLGGSTDITNGGSEPSNGDKIGNWADLTGAATDATESNTANQPTYETNVQNGLPAVKFDGTQAKGLEGTFVRTNNAGLTIILVGKFNNTARRAFFEFYRVGGGARGFFFTYGYQASSSQGLDNTQFNVWSAYDTGTQSTLWENGVNKYTNMNNYAGFPSTAFTGNGAYVLGDDQTGGDRLEGYIGEFLVFDRQLTTPELTTLQTYLKNKWGTP